MCQAAIEEKRTIYCNVTGRACRWASPWAAQLSCYGAQMLLGHRCINRKDTKNLLDFLLPAIILPQGYTAHAYKNRVLINFSTYRICLFSGPCEPCSEEEKASSLCSITGHQQSLDCSWNKTQQHQFQKTIFTPEKLPDKVSCDERGKLLYFSSPQNSMSVLSFECIIVSILVVAFVVMIWRKKRVL